MKNLRMAQKLGLGFGCILLLTCVLGYQALSEMSAAVGRAESTAYKYLPELSGMSEVERSFGNAYVAVRTYSLTEDEKAYAEGIREIESIGKPLGALRELVAKHKDLVVLGEFVDSFGKEVNSYRKFTEDTKAKVQDVAKMRTAMNDAAEQAIAKFGNVIKAIEGVIESDLTRGETANTMVRVRNALRVEEVTTGIMQARMLVWRAQLQHDANLLAQGLEVVHKLVPLVDEIRSRLVTQQARIDLDAGVEQLQHYIREVQGMARGWEELERINKQRAEISTRAEQAVSDSSERVMGNVRKASITSADDARSNQTLLAVVLAAAVLLGVVIALVLTRLITGPLRKGVDFAQAVAAGRLDETLDVHSRDEVGQLSDALRSMVDALKTKIREAGEQTAQALRMGDEAKSAMEEARKAQAAAEAAKREGMLAAARQLEGIVEVVTSASTQLSAKVEESERGAAQASGRIGETATAMEEMNASVLEVARSAGSAAGVSNDARDRAEEGAHMVESVVACMGEVERQAEKLKDDMLQLGQHADAIGTIMNVISDIADQTNLLALNAAIEAARAGEAGRGFAVVADEVRKLAEKTVQATAQVGNAIKGVQHSAEQNMKGVDSSVERIGEATRLARQAGDALKNIVSLVESSASQVHNIATAAEQQSATSEEINESLGTVNQTSQETARAMEEAAQAVSDLSQQAQRLAALIAEMKRG